MGYRGRGRRPRREALRQGLLLVLASIAAFAAAAAALSFLRAVDYTSFALVRSAGAPTGADDALALARTASLARRALDRAGARGESPDALLEHSDVEARSARELVVNVRAGRPGAARRLAGAYARELAAALPASARAEAGPAGPAERDRGTLRAALLGAASGLLVGLLLALLREALDIRRTSSRRLARRLRLSSLGAVPDVPSAVERAYELPALDHREGPEGVAYAQLATALESRARDAGARVLLVVGTVEEDEGTRVAANLAAALALQGLTVAVTELDPARPLLRRLFALERGPGLAEISRGEAPPDEGLALVPVPGRLAVLPLGEGELAPGTALEAALAGLRAGFELVLVCGPPLLEEATPDAGADALVVAVHLRKVRHSRRPELEHVLRKLEQPVLGFVLVGAGSAHRADERPPHEREPSDHDRKEHHEERVVGGAPHIPERR
jgi:Mrp family chromosome partitioning ATPase